MKITKSQLKQIIQEELESVVQEIDIGDVNKAMDAKRPDSSQIYVSVVNKYLGQMIEDLKEAGVPLQPLADEETARFDLKSIASEMAHELQVGLTKG